MRHALGANVAVLEVTAYVGAVGACQRPRPGSLPQHAQAMQPLTEATALAPFRGEQFTEAGVTSTFSRRDGKFYVRTDGPDGKLQEFEATHTLGVYPLQQVLIPMPNGGMQALGIAWDARPRARGGQRWFRPAEGEEGGAGGEGGSK